MKTIFSSKNKEDFSNVGSYSDKIKNKWSGTINIV